MKPEERVNLMFSQSAMSKKDWANKVGMSLNYLVLVCKGKHSISGSMLVKISQACPEYNPDWVIRGFGAMLKDGTPAPSVANSVAQNEPENDAISVKMLDFVMKENAYLKAKLDEALAIIGNQARLSGKLNLQPNAGYAKVVKLLPELASVA